jgi:hypothetical protein
MKDKKRLLLKMMIDIIDYYDVMIENCYVDSDNAGSRNYRKLKRNAVDALRSLQGYVNGAC